MRRHVVGLHPVGKGLLRSESSPPVETLPTVTETEADVTALSNDSLRVAQGSGATVAPGAGIRRLNVGDTARHGCC